MLQRNGLFVLLLVSGLICVSTQDTLSNFISGAPEGVPGIDYPEYTSVPRRTSFTCRDRKPGFYADPDTRCQVWFWCDTFLIKHSFLCPNLTVFNQKIRGCDWWYNVDCTLAISQYVNNDELYQVSPEEKARESSRKEKELLDRQRGWKRPQQKLDDDRLLITEDGTSVSSLNDADNDFAFSSTLHPDLILSSTTSLPTRSPFTRPPETLPPLTRPPFTLPPLTRPPETRPPATLPPATLPPATLPPATLPPATLPPATLRPATLRPATLPLATFPPVTPPPFTSPQWVPAIPLPASTPRAIVPAQAHPPAPFLFRPIANAIPINFPTPPRTRRPPTTPLPTVANIQQTASPAASTDVDRGSQHPAFIIPPTPTVTVSGRRRRPSTLPPTTVSSIIAGDLDPANNGLTGTEDSRILEITTPVFGTTLNVESRRLFLTSSSSGSSSPELPHTLSTASADSTVTNRFPSFPTRNTPLRVNSSPARPSFQPFPTTVTTTTTTTVAPPPPPPPTTPPTTRIPPSTVTSTLDDITTQVFNFGIAFGSRIEGQASENVAQSTELPLPSTSTEPPRRRKFIGGDAQTFPPFPVTTFSPKTAMETIKTTATTTQPTITAAIFNRRRGAIRNVTTSTESSVTESNDETAETAANTFASTKLTVPAVTKKVTATRKPARTFPSFPVTTFRPSTEFGQRDDIGVPDNVNELTERSDDATITIPAAA